ncbi:disease resistance protein RUN1-like [Telopea speciosissima]|uniref:disease resistance protein RUN1-like n=1 Tax=Telopea speciosissima TaxID=54955 RepID=UPI001CC6FBC2|nr:disease resistance protein RUN1-like [Telopea speciosissima]
MGGLGKTTIAKAVYNCIFKSFNGSSFLMDVRQEASQGNNSLVSLQKRLLKDIFKTDLDISNSSQGSKLLEKRLCREKILLILDDVDDYEQLDTLAGGINWFGQGNRVIITTRDDHCLNVHKVGKDIKIYKPEELNAENSLQLFSLHAFSMSKPLEDFKELSCEVVQHAGGLPLTLEVLGSSLCDKNKEEWEDTLRGLKDILDNKVSGMSIRSYDDKRKGNEAIPIWEACELYPRLAIKELTQKHLLKMDVDGRLRMHDELRFMGRRIVLKDSNRHPAKRTRLWSADEISEVLEKGKGTQMVECILLSSAMDLSFDAFDKMPNLRFLRVGSDEVVDEDNKLITGDFSHLPYKLRWFRWVNAPLEILPAKFYHEDLVHLDLSKNNIKQAWNDRPENNIKRFQKLKVLNLRGCRHLSISPDFFSWFPCLQRLDLTSCDNLLLPDSICQLNCLMGVGQLEKLEKLELSSCLELVRLPISMRRMRSLSYFDMTNTKIVKLPDDFSELSSLELESLLELSSTLTRLELKNCRSLQIISDLSHLECLKELSLNDCHSLLPDLSNLKRLRILDLKHDENLEEIHGFEGTESLEELSFQGCHKLRKLPDLSNLKSLSVLDVSGCKNLEEIHGLEGTKSLKELDVEGCDKLRELLNLSNLKRLVTLHIKCVSLQNIDDLKGTESLEELTVGDCHKLTELPDLSNLKRLRSVCIVRCVNLVKIHRMEGTESLEK